MDRQYIYGIKLISFFLSILCACTDAQYAYGQYPNQQAFIPQTGQYAMQPAYGQQLGYNTPQQSLIPGFGNLGAQQAFPQTTFGQNLFPGAGIGGRSLEGNSQVPSQFQQPATTFTGQTMPTNTNFAGQLQSFNPTANTQAAAVEATAGGMNQPRSFDGSSVGQMQYALPQSGQQGTNTMAYRA